MGVLPVTAKRQLGFAAAMLVVGCIDFGYRLEPPETGDASSVQVDGSPAGGATDAAACVEGPTEPTTDGLQIRLITLNVDLAVVAIKSGDVVTWTNTDSERHTVTAGAPGAELPPEQGGFDSGDLGSGEVWAYRFCTVRTAIYFCRTHPQQMNGYRIIVEAE